MEEKITISKEMLDKVELAITSAIKTNSLLQLLFIMTPESEKLMSIKDLLYSNILYSDIITFIDEAKWE